MPVLTSKKDWANERQVNVRNKTDITEEFQIINPNRKREIENNYETSTVIILVGN